MEKKLIKIQTARVNFVVYIILGLWKPRRVTNIGNSNDFIVLSFLKDNILDTYLNFNTLMCILCI